MSDMNPKHTPILRDNETLYVLGHDGSNEWSAGVQSAWHDRHWRIAKATELHAALIEHAALKARCEALEKTLGEVEPSIGWRGDGPESSEEFYCEFCGASDLSYAHIEHKSECVVLRIRALLSPRDGEAK